MSQKIDKFQHLSLSQQQAIRPVVDYLTLKCNDYYFSETVVAMLPLLFHIAKNNREVSLLSRANKDGVRASLFIHSKEVRHLKYHHTSGKRISTTEQTALAFNSSSVYIDGNLYHFSFEIHSTSTGYKLIDRDSTLKALTPSIESTLIHEPLLDFCNKLIGARSSIRYEINTIIPSTAQKVKNSSLLDLCTKSGFSITGAFPNGYYHKGRDSMPNYINNFYLIKEEDMNIKVIRGAMLNARSHVNGTSICFIDEGLIISVNYCHFIIFRDSLSVITPSNKVIVLTYFSSYNWEFDLSRASSIHRIQMITSTPFNGFGELNIPANEPTVKEVEQPLVEKSSSPDKEQEDKPIEVNQDELDLKSRFAQIGTKITEVAAVVELWQQEENDIAFGHILELYDQIDTLDEDGRERLDTIITAFEKRLTNQLEQAEKEKKFSQSVTFQVLESLFGIKR